MADWIIRVKSRKIYRQTGDILHHDREYLRAYRKEWTRTLLKKLGIR